MRSAVTEVWYPSAEEGPGSRLKLMGSSYATAGLTCCCCPCVLDSVLLAVTYLRALDRIVHNVDTSSCLVDVAKSWGECFSGVMRWVLQTMDPADEDKFDFDPLDVTKVWPEHLFPLQPVGRMVLNKNREPLLLIIPAHAVSGVACWSPRNCWTLTTAVRHPVLAWCPGTPHTSSPRSCWAADHCQASQPALLSLGSVLRWWTTVLWCAQPLFVVQS